jgi:medium-chain acyl-[acyl-carrier-protein] hydrolase
MEAGSTFLAAQPNPAARVRLFCFPHAGGGPNFFFPWTVPLAPEIECVRVQYPGHERRFNEMPCATIADLVDEIGSQWHDLGGTPFAFYGHSFGGLVAFELARYLRRSRIAKPQRLFLGSCRAPHLELPFPAIYMQPDDEFIKSIQVRYGGIPAAVSQDRELLSIFMTAMRADFRAYELYDVGHELPLSVPITAFAGMDDKAATSASMQEWAGHTEKGFDMNVLPGGHFFSNSSLATIIQTIKRQLLDANKPASHALIKHR